MSITGLEGNPLLFYLKNFLGSNYNLDCLKNLWTLIVKNLRRFSVTFQKTRKFKWDA